MYFTTHLPKRPNGLSMGFKNGIIADNIEYASSSRTLPCKNIHSHRVSQILNVDTTVDKALLTPIHLAEYITPQHILSNHVQLETLIKRGKTTHTKADYQQTQTAIIPYTAFSSTIKIRIYILYGIYMYGMR